MAKSNVITNPEVKKTLEGIEKVGKTVKNLAQLRELFEEEVCESNTVQLTVQQLFEFGCAIDVWVDSLYYHLREANPQEPANPPEPPKGPTREEPRGYQINLTLAQVDAVNKGLREARALAMALIEGRSEEWRYGETVTLAGMIFENVVRVKEILKAGSPENH